MSFSSLLGYTNDLLEPTLEPYRLARANSIVDKLLEIDNLINSALPDAMAVNVGELKVNYPAFIQTLKSEGSRLLNELASVTGLPVLYNKYTGRYLGSATSPLFVKSLY